MMNFILLLLAFSLTNSNTAVSGIVLAFTIPAVFFGILAGIFVDRWNKKYVLFITNILRAGLLLLLAFLHTNLIGIYAITFLIAIITQFFIPAETPMIPLLVKKEDLYAANSLFGIGLFGSLFVAYALSGSFLFLFSVQHALLILCGFFILAGLSILFIKHVNQKSIIKNNLQKDSLFREFHQTIRLVVKKKNLYNAFLMLALSQVLILTIAVVGPGFAERVLKITVDAFPLLFVTPAVIGMGLGTFVLTNYFANVSRQKSATVGLFLSSLSLFLLPLAGNFTGHIAVRSVNTFLPQLLQINILHLMMLLAFVLGFANALIFVPSNTIVQEETSDEIRGKIYGALNTFVSLLSLLPVILVGSLADVIGVANVLTFVAACIAIIGIARVFFM